jgi:hypothetical protein
LKNGTNFTDEQLEALIKFVSNPNRELEALTDYIVSLDLMRKQRKLPTSYVAFEILDNIYGSLEKGNSVETILERMPNKFSQNLIPIPAAVIGALLVGWNNYKNSEINDMSRSFGLLGEEKRRPPISKLKQISKELNLVRSVVAKIYQANLDGKAITLSEAISQVSLNNNYKASHETIRKAWQKHRVNFNAELTEKGLPGILG